MRLQMKFSRYKKKMTQKQVAELIGISVRSISQYELGRQSPTYANMKKLSDLYQVPVDDLYEDEDILVNRVKG